MSQLKLLVLGPAEVHIAGRLVEGFAYTKPGMLLIYLAVEANIVHRREQVALDFWPDLPSRPPQGIW
jgi:DNA-binding SARP family transcriptional activator